MQQKLRERIFERWVFYEEISPKTAFKLSNDMSSQQVSGTHKKLAEFCKKRNITRHSFERLSEYQPVLVMPKKFAEMRWNGKNLRKHNKSMKCSKSTAICRKSLILLLPFDLSKMML